MAILKAKLSSGGGISGQLARRGPQGYSAYDIAVQHGYTGTEEDWVNKWLRGTIVSVTTDSENNLVMTDINGNVFSVPVPSLSEAADSAVQAKQSATDAQTAQTAAAESATSASKSATSAKACADAASVSAASAASSASAASTSATNVSASAKAASGYATDASASAAAAAESAGAAATSETNAAASATSAASSATAADISKTDAQTAATNAASSASDAATSATNAKTSETNARTSATNAATSATAAASSATSAANSARSLQSDWSVTDTRLMSYIKNKPTTWSTLSLVKPTCTNSITDLTIRPMVDFSRGNRLAFLPADQIIIEQTIDGGTTWTDAGISDANKAYLFSEVRSSAIPIPKIDGKVNTKCGIRITITAMKYDVPDGTAETDKYKYWNSNYVKSAERYCSLSDFVFWNIAAANRIKVTVQKALGSKADNWITCFSDDTFGMTGEAGANYVRVNEDMFGGGGIGQPTNCWNYRFIFFTTSNKLDDNITLRPTVTQGIININGYGANIWVKPNGLAFNDHLYAWDANQDATFPAGLNATTLMQGGKKLDDIITAAIKAALAAATVSDGKITYKG